MTVQPLIVFIEYCGPSVAVVVILFANGGVLLLSPRELLALVLSTLICTFVPFISSHEAATP